MRIINKLGNKLGQINLVWLLAMAVPAAWGGITSCATSANGNALSSYGSTNFSDGCASVDVTYVNLGLTGTSQSGHGTAPTSGSLSIYSSGGNLLVDGFAPISGSGSEGGTIGYEAEANTVGGRPLAFSSMTLPTDAVNVPSGASVTIAENLCLDASQPLVGGNCSAADHGIITEHITSIGTSYSCSFGTAGVCVSATSNEVSFVNLLAAPKMIAISEAVSVNSSNWVQLSSLDDSFVVEMETPEPASFVLMGVALVGLFLRARAL